jgi:hypothetical protein
MSALQVAIDVGGTFIPPSGPVQVRISNCRDAGMKSVAGLRISGKGTQP